LPPWGSRPPTRMDSPSILGATASAMPSPMRTVARSPRPKASARSFSRLRRAPTFRFVLPARGSPEEAVRRAPQPLRWQRRSYSRPVRTAPRRVRVRTRQRTRTAIGRSSIVRPARTSQGASSMTCSPGSHPTFCTTAWLPPEGCLDRGAPGRTYTWTTPPSRAAASCLTELEPHPPRLVDRERQPVAVLGGLLGRLVETDAQPGLRRNGPSEKLLRHRHRHRPADVGDAQVRRLCAREVDLHLEVLLAAALVECVLDEVVGDAVEELARKPRLAVDRSGGELDVGTRIAGLERFPPLRRAGQRQRLVASRRAQLVERDVQALGDLRELAVDERLQLGRLLGPARLRSGAKRRERLQQVLHIVRQARAGLVDRLRVRVLALQLLAPLGVVEVGEQPREQLQMQQQR